MLKFLSDPALAWPLLITATAGETLWFILLKRFGSYEIWPWSYLLYLLVAVNIVLLSFPLKTLPLGTVYAFWTGASAVAIAVAGLLLYNDDPSIWRLMFIAVTVVGIVGLQLTSR